MTDTNQTPPLPPNVPVQYTPIIATGASLIVFGIAPLLHQYFPRVPSLDLNAVQATLGLLVGVAIWVHTMGYKRAMDYVITTVLPQIFQQYGPQIEAAVIAAIKAEMNKNGDVGMLSASDVKAVKLSRAAEAPKVESLPVSQPNFGSVDSIPMTNDDFAVVRTARKARGNRA